MSVLYPSVFTLFIPNLPWCIILVSFAFFAMSVISESSLYVGSHEFNNPGNNDGFVILIRPRNSEDGYASFHKRICLKNRTPHSLFNSSSVITNFDVISPFNCVLLEKPVLFLSFNVLEYNVLCIPNCAAHDI